MKYDERVWRAQADRQHGAIAHGQLRASGLSARQIERRAERGELDSIFRGVYRVAGAPRTFEQRAMAATLAAAGVASHRCAARLWAMRGFEDEPVEVTVGGRRQPELGGVVGHTTAQLLPVETTTRQSVPVTTPARTLLDLGAVTPIEAVESALEDALHRGLVSRSWLERTVAQAHAARRGGAGVLRSLLLDRDPALAPTESALEDEIARIIRQAGLPAPVRQHWVDGVRIDLCFPPARLAIEAQSMAWHASRADLQRDCEKQTLLARLGWRVLVFTWHDVRQRAHVIADAVAAALDADYDPARCPST